MLRPSKERNIEIIVSILGFIVFAAMLSKSRQDHLSGIEIVLAVLGLKTGLVAGIMAIVAHFRDVRPYLRMRQGKGVLARWTISRERWITFLDQCHHITHGSNALSNSLKLPSDFRDGGITAVISDNAICLNDDFHPLKSSATVRAQGAVLEIFQRVQAGKTSTTLLAYRLPIPAGADRDVETIIKHYAASTIATRKLGRKVALIMLGLSLALLGVVLWLV